MTLTDHAAVITGASSGIGAATARVLSEAGMRLVLTARREDRLRQLAAQLPTETAIVPGDITDHAMPQSLIDTALKSFGRCDAVVNNAGIMIAAPIDSLDLDAMSRMIQVNVDAAFRLAYTALRYFKSVNRGYLINTSSILGTKIRPTAGAYAGTKFAIEALTEALRIELAGTAVKISSVQPGLVMTELHDNFPVHPKDSLNIQHPLQPEDIARAIRWLLEQPPHVRVPKVMLTAGEQAL